MTVSVSTKYKIIRRHTGTLSFDCQKREFFLRGLTFKTQCAFQEQGGGVEVCRGEGGLKLLSILQRGKGNTESYLHRYLSVAGTTL